MRRFVPLAMGDGDEYLTVEQLEAELGANAAQATFPLPDLEEQIALRAFTAQAKGKTCSRAAVESVAERGRQRVFVDVLDAEERVTIERFRRVAARKKLPPKAYGTDNADPLTSSRNDFLDAALDTLKILDKYLPKGTN